MDINVHNENENIRKIEDIIDIQKANGNYSIRQIAFNLPSDNENIAATNLVKSLESGLSTSSSAKKKKKLKHKQNKILMPDVISWPSDSDITVLKMKLCLDENNSLKDKIENIPGDGLHLPDSSSMVNLATLIKQSQPSSKNSMNLEEYLLPLSSWEQEGKDPKVKHTILDKKSARFKKDLQSIYNNWNDEMDSKDDVSFSALDMKSRLAKFFRLYFCPCCTCLYEIENNQDDPSFYCNKREK